MRRRYLHFAAAFGCCFVICGMLVQPSLGMVNTSNHLSYREAPNDDPGWNFVGEMFNGTGVYLGDGWVITPYHVYRPRAEEASIQLDQMYDEVPGTSKRIKFDTQADIDADLIMFRINGDPNLYPVGSVPNVVEIRPEAIGTRPVATIIGTGFGRDDAPSPDPPPTGPLQTWDVGGQTYQGYDISDTRIKQWGSNSVSVYGAVTPPGGYGTTEVLYSMFNQSPARSEETQPVDKDSGGAAFIKRSGVWELSGLVIAMAAPEGYPHAELSLREHAIYETGAMYADLSKYSDQISAIRLTPLPGDVDWNGRVDLRDFSLLRQTFGQTGPDLAADFDQSGAVDDADLDILQRNFGVISGNGVNWPDGVPLLAPVLAPEPATMFVLLVAAPLLLRSRKRRKTA